MTYDPMIADPISIEAADTIGVIEVLDFSDPVAANSPVLLGKHGQDRLVRTIGERMRQARELCNLSQSEAAKRLGYANPSKLSKVEAATDTNSVPLWLICGAASLYEVSVDFLFGFTDDFETGVPRGTQAWMLDAWDRMRQRDLLALDWVHREVAAVSGGIGGMLSAVSELSAAISTYCTRNPEFEETLGSATVIHRLGKLEAAASTAEVSLRKLRLS
ncbi:helix-turn-helix domain-containing protein [Lysobacter zhanggongensis]|uniref:Helix-turn-helix transcriptional regulator n=1 Tax=Lysobacter zhanggongensis TaxID=1774951 RepID=A0ABU7YP43_9GAMM